jgi:hypothetical protein
LKLFNVEFIEQEGEQEVFSVRTRRTRNIAKAATTLAWFLVGAVTPTFVSA